MKLHELQEARAAAVAEMRAINEKCTAENNREPSDVEQRSFDAAKAKMIDLDKKIGRAQTLADAERSAPAIVHGRLGDGAFEERARDFSITKAIRAALPRDIGGGGVDAGFEREISQEVARRSGRVFEGIAVPDQVFLQERRTLLAGSSAAELVPNVHRADLYIDRLRASLVTGRLGATILDGLVGTVDIPRQNGSSTAQWVAEDGSLSETDAAFDDVTLAPKTVGAMTSYSRRTLLSASPSIEQIVRNDLASVVANAIDYQAMVGDGSGNTPTGILHATGSHALPSMTPTWAEVLEFPARIEGADAALGTLAWAMSPYGAKLLRSTAKVSSTDSVMIMEAPDSLAGYPAAKSTALTTDSSPQTSLALFGDWAQLLIGYWSGIDILINPYETTAYAKGRVLVRAMRDVDVAVRHGEAFAHATLAA